LEWTYKNGIDSGEEKFGKRILRIHVCHQPPPKWALFFTAHTPEYQDCHLLGNTLFFKIHAPLLLNLRYFNFVPTLCQAIVYHYRWLIVR
jgi:hypothetical protein